MKRLIAILVLAVALYGCNTNGKQGESINNFRERNRAKRLKEIEDNTYKHELRKFNIGKSEKGASGWFFLVAGSYTGATSEATVRFYYKDENNEYNFMESPLKKVRIKIENTPKPYATFGDVNKSDTWVVIHCREQDFQPEININQLR